MVVPRASNRAGNSPEPVIEIARPLPTQRFQNAKPPPNRGGVIPRKSNRGGGAGVINKNSGLHTPYVLVYVFQ